MIEVLWSSKPEIDKEQSTMDPLMEKAIVVL